MAPISTDLVGLAYTEQPAAAFLSIVILFIASIALLVLCASCKKHSFELENSRAPAEQKTSTLVSVARTNDSAARHNPTANEITGDEMGYEVEDDGNVAVSQGGIVYKPWRSHTLTHGSSLQVNGGVGAMTASS
ncbi:uncharacterized protein si:ch73-204p21.2 [Danio aesculapii]|uniref:uncharacterized protein si:ch73-204p21.2 n=1 Tax=Danio aesculapii TaxID=1142201 RepID=UPI0024C04BA6|nr:uncharacterized protein si:ch73-204p21.2 [Danio aesculapii]XP_056333328.1 uncharacterized protein si:ch73-204p21.2 [Danio aesculapii]